MKCNNCGRELPYGTLTCPCGNSFVYQQATVLATPEVKKGFTKTQKTVILSLLFVLFGVMLTMVIISFNNNDKEQPNENSVNPTRTIMIYMDGSTLETEGKIASSDLAAVKPDKVDLNSTNVLVYVGGTKKWFNDFDPNENAIYKLGNNGYEKVKSYDKKNMGDASTLATFLNYAYDNYKAGHYNLVFYNHGGAIDGAIYDDYTEDNLSLEDFSKALNDSPFNEENKLDTVIFRTCLNGTLEVASVFKKYSEYIVFSEEVTWGASITNVLGYFINELKPDATGLEVGRKFIDAYSKQMDEIDPLGIKVITYSIVDLSKIDNVVSELNSFIDSVNIKDNYYAISKVRNDLYQFGVDAPSYDTVDLVSLLRGISSYATKSSANVIQAIDDAVVYSYSNLKSSNGLSIYFPYKGSDKAKMYFMNVYNKLDFSDNYYSFIKKFNSAGSEAVSFNFSYSDNKTAKVDSGKEASIQLTPEQQKNYLGSVYIVFTKNKEHPNYYHYIYSSNDAVLSEDGKLTTQIGNNLVRSVPDEKGQWIFMDINHRVYDGIHSYSTNAIIADTNDPLRKEWQVACTLRLTFKDNKPIISIIEKQSRDERIEGIAFDTSTYNLISKYKPEYKILDKNGKVLPTKDWAIIPTLEGLEFKLDEFEMEKISIEDTYEYYVLFLITDVNRETNYSELIKVGD